MMVGTKSILFGAHQFLLHPWFVVAAWWKLYGFPWDPRLWVAFFVHDLGYWGKPNMDGPEGETHVLLGAEILTRLFDRRQSGRCPYCRSWLNLGLFHSRFFAKNFEQPVSKLGIADKLSIVLTPAWLYLPMARASGEIHEYMDLAKSGKYQTMRINPTNYCRWYADVQEYLRRWVEDHRDGKEDTWTPEV